MIMKNNTHSRRLASRRKLRSTVAAEIDERLIELCAQQMARRGWNQRQLAEKMEMDESEISLLLNRKRKWSLKTIEAFTKATGMSVAI
jgi:ribosome-binding protein aMBF1 (putative translation factor)